MSRRLSRRRNITCAAVSFAAFVVLCVRHTSWFTGVLAGIALMTAACYMALAFPRHKMSGP